MIKIIFKTGQGLGNQLWLFAVAKSLSEKLSMDLKIENFNKFLGKDFLNLEYSESKDKLSNSYLIENDKTEFNIFNERLYYDHELKYILSGYDENIINVDKNTILEGIFQSEKYFFGDLDKLKRYIKLNQSTIESNPIKKDSCILNIRGGEYKRHKDFILPKKYWDNAIEYFKYKYDINKFIIVTDDFNYARALFPKYEIISGDIKKCYAAIFNCKNIIVSNSSFSYFPCKTGIRKNVIAPMYWARPFNKNKRWISPCNIYSEWLWQDVNGEINKYEDCLSIATKTENFYKKEFCILINKKEIPSKGIFNFLPNKVKSIFKKLLGIILPKHFG